MDLLYDPLTALFLLLITGVGSLIHVYSIGYMEHDARRAPVLRLPQPVRRRDAAAGASSENYLGLFLGWEGVGLASYLLIGFWQHKHSAAAAAKKAFVINRVGDMGLSHGDHAGVRHLRLDQLHRHQRRRRRGRPRRR